MLGTISAFAYRHRETKKNLCRGGRSQDLPSKLTSNQQSRHLKYIRAVDLMAERITTLCLHRAVCDSMCVQLKWVQRVDMYSLVHNEVVLQVEWNNKIVHVESGRSGDRIPVGARFSTSVRTGPRAHPASCTMGTGSLPVVKSGRGVTLTTHPLLVAWSRKSRAIPQLTLWAVRPVQSLSACTRVHFTFTYTSTPPMGRTTCTEPQCLYNGAL